MTSLAKNINKLLATSNYGHTNIRPVSLLVVSEVKTATVTSSKMIFTTFFQSESGKAKEHVNKQRKKGLTFKQKHTGERYREGSTFWKEGKGEFLSPFLMMMYLSDVFNVKNGSRMLASFFYMKLRIT